MAGVGVTVETAVGTGIVCSNINALAATTTRTLASVFFNLKIFPQTLTNFAGIYAVRLVNPAMCGKKGITTSLQPDAGTVGDGIHLRNKLLFCRLSWINKSYVA
jgi:cAMP phosphodiesterase